MIEARKENKVYTINEQMKDRYLKEGFDIYENGEIVEHTPLKKIAYSEHLKKMAELEAKKDKEIANLKEGAKLSVYDNVYHLLETYANEKGVDLGSVSTAEGILKKISESEK